MKNKNKPLKDLFETMGNDLKYIYSPKMEGTAKEKKMKKKIKKLKEKLSYRTGETLPLVQVQAVLMFLNQWNEPGKGELIKNALQGDITLDPQDITAAFDTLSHYKWTIDGFLRLRQDFQAAIIQHALMIYMAKNPNKLTQSELKQFYLTK